MELTVISVVALLLLLSGAATPLRPGNAPACATVAMRRWFGGLNQQSRRRQSPHGASRGPGFLNRLAGYRAAQQRLALDVSLCAGRLTRVLAHTRFGATTVAFHPAAPPLA